MGAGLCRRIDFVWTKKNIFTFETKENKNKLCIVFQKLDGFGTVSISAFRIRTQNLSSVFTFCRGVQNVKSCPFGKIAQN